MSRDQSFTATKSKETRNKILDERTLWHEIIYKSLIPTFGSLQSYSLFPYFL